MSRFRAGELVVQSLDCADVISVFQQTELQTTGPNFSQYSEEFTIYAARLLTFTNRATTRCRCLSSEWPSHETVQGSFTNGPNSVPISQTLACKYGCSSLIVGLVR